MLAAWLSAAPARAQTPPPEVNTGPLTDTQMAEETDNPLSRNIVLPLRYELQTDNGYYREDLNSFRLAQALIPFVLSDDWALITRTNLPFVSRPPRTQDGDWATGLDNGTTTFFLSPEHITGPLIAGIGPVLYYPTSTNSSIGIHKWGSGPSIGLVYRPVKTWQFALIVNNIWSFGGAQRSGDSKNSLLVNPRASYYFGDGWSLSSSPSITANWLSRPGEQWTVPVGGGIGKTLHVAHDGLKLSMAAYYNAIRPQPDRNTWRVQLTLTLVLPQ